MFRKEDPSFYVAIIIISLLMAQWSFLLPQEMQDSWLLQK